MSVVGVVAGVITIIAIASIISMISLSRSKRLDKEGYIVFAGKLESMDHSIQDVVEYLTATNSLCSYVNKERCPNE